VKEDCLNWLFREEYLMDFFSLVSDDEKLISPFFYDLLKF